jgi:hypothetical protein
MEKITVHETSYLYSSTNIILANKRGRSVGIVRLRTQATEFFNTVKEDETVTHVARMKKAMNS